MKKVMVFGTFDILHKGHLSFFSQAGKFGKVIVVVARDSTVRKLKGKLPKNNEKKRKENIKKQKLKMMRVFLGDLKDPYKIIRREKPDIICLGYDQRYFVDDLEKTLMESKIKAKIIRLKPHRPDIYKSSKIKQSF